MVQSVDIAIIGAGYSGAMLASILGEQGRSVALIDPTTHVPRGAAYSTRWPEHLLNVPAIKMGAHADTPEGFTIWLSTAQGAAVAASHGITTPISGDAFLPRALYGDYLTAITAPGLAKVTRITQSAKHITREGKQYRIGFVQGAAILAKKLVLATGNGFASEVLSHPSYFGKPWRCNFDKLANAPEGAPIIILGSGLTAVDTLVSLLSRSVTTPILVLSRHGAFPAVHDATPLTTAAIFDPTSVAGKELSQQMRIVRRFIAAHVASGQNWQSAMDGLRPHTNALWQCLSDAQKQRFFRHLFTHWNRARHRMAPSLGPVIAGGRYEVRRASVQAVAAHSVTLAGGETLSASTIFDCRGPRYGIRTNPLFSTLFDANILRPHHTGLGLQSYGDAGLISTPGAPPIHAIGPLLLGEQLETTAVPELRAQIKALAAAL